MTTSERAPDPLLEVRDLRVTFREGTDQQVEAVDGISFEVHPGEVLAIVGESGSGKSITAHSVLGLLPPLATVAGSIRLRRRTSGRPEELIGLSSGAMRRIRGAEVAMIFQEPSTALNPVYTIGWQIKEALRAHSRVSGRTARDMVVEILRRVGIPEPEKRVGYYPHQFSGGQRQRIVIAMALIQNPDLIIADEPTTALDVTVQAEILDLLRAHRDEAGTAIVLITHNMGVVADLADRMVVMYQGCVVETGPVSEVFEQPQHPYTRNLLAAVPRVGVQSAREPVAAPDRIAVEGRDVVIEYPAGFRRASFRAVNSVSFRIAAGEVLGLVGESGSGKTSLGRAVAGLNPISSGSLVALGQELKGISRGKLRSSRKDVGFVFQDPATSFNPRIRLFDCLAEPFIVNNSTERPQLRQAVNELFDLVHLPRSFAERFPHELSGGQRQRVGIARAIALRPSLIIADEPTSALDVSVQAQILTLFTELQDELNYACLFITHDLAVVDMLAHRTAVMRRGEIVEQGATREVLLHPQHEYTQQLIGSLPVPDPAVQRDRSSRRQAVTS
ncbi:ABC transporter ATP-binding protein [Microlunatus endophyticus]|uniref:ABC transporter ATP-binding protein n=1 Tax=Microlunatus endophyticus TaxID=1716077 RepID=A0A917W7T5_9ACTN|nr:ABC transporter ATP-binding protein [Microlunatus endophyticus]GGL73773.1 ABC transporter ATP-binding protein [Microlunatus endophyticus]